jgi:hypothetical protein
LVQAHGGGRAQPRPPPTGVTTFERELAQAHEASGAGLLEQCASLVSPSLTRAELGEASQT